MFTRVRFVLTIAALASAAGTALAQTATLDARPSSISVAPWDEKVEARVVILNTGKAAITSASLTVFSNDGIVALVEPATSPRLQESVSFAWKLTLDLAKARVPGVLELDAAYTVAGERTPRHAFQQLKLAAADGAVVDKAVEVTLTGAYDAVSVERPGRGYVVVVNNLDVPATITGIRVQTSDPKSFLPNPDFDEDADRESTRFAPFEVPPRSSRSQFIELRVSPSIISGKHRVVLAVDAAWKRHGRDQARTLLVGQDVTLGVFFESEILEALSVPSFLLLPGALFLLTIAVLLKFDWGRDDKPTQWPKLEAKTPEFWVVAITWSGIFAWLYTFLGVDFLIRYGAKDLRNVWLLNIALGAGLYFLMVLYNKQKNRNRPSASDDATTTLKKMGRRGLGLRLQKAEVTVKSAPLTAFIVDDTKPEAVWAAPPIDVKWTGDETTLPAKKAVIELIDAGSAADLFKALSKSQGSVTVNFSVGGSLQGPASFAETDIKRVAAEPIVKVS